MKATARSTTRLRQHTSVLTAVMGVLLLSACSSVEKDLRRLGDTDAVIRQEALLRLLDRDGRGLVNEPYREQLVLECEALTRDDSALVRSTALLSLARLNRARAQDAARKRLADDPSSYVRIDAARLIGDLDPTPDSVPTLATALASDRDVQVRMACVLALAALGGPDAEQVLQQALLDPSRSVRFHAAQSIEELTGEAPLVPLDRRARLELFPSGR